MRCHRWSRGSEGEEALCRWRRGSEGDKEEEDLFARSGGRKKTAANENRCNELCKIDSEGKARKVIGCFCLVIKDYGEESEGLHIVQEYVKSH
ncbi:40S ribosomal protein S12 [Platanthera guangdongensis]|uniref:40S ribosomal protein S12 n=1 Tax=Platanthera guangdongensis TaxID=2320717 RepID=A0ABR2LC69_9ASPA